MGAKFSSPIAEDKGLGFDTFAVERFQGKGLRSSDLEWNWPRYRTFRFVKLYVLKVRGEYFPPSQSETKLGIRYVFLQLAKDCYLESA